MTAERGSNVIEEYADGAFHVHTYRCKHAGDELEEAYILRAIELGKKGIVFTDHAPFPGNPFGNRIDMEELSDYIAELKSLKMKYQGRIEVGIGLEIEFLPSYMEYYRELSDSGDIEWMVLGQHMYEYSPGVYNFSDPKEVKDAQEYKGLCEAMIAGMETGMFRVVAHPDRAFRRRTQWDETMEELSRQVIETAIRTGTILEQNVASMRENHHYWNEFWQLLNTIVEKKPGTSARVIRGLDAHSVAELQ